MVNYSKFKTVSIDELNYDQGLRGYMLAIYNYMAIALLLTGISAYYAGNSPAFLQMLFSQKADGSFGMSGLGMILTFAPLGFIMALSRIENLNINTAQILFWTFSVVMGLSLSTIFVTYTNESIARTFFVTASTFGAASIYGYTTKKDLTSFGSFLFMGLMGIVIASLVNIFVGSSAIQFVTSILGVVIFTGLAAYDTSTLKRLYYTQSHVNNADSKKIAIKGALQLYLDFINIFVSLLRLMGDRKN